VGLRPDLSQTRLFAVDSKTISDIRVANGWVTWGQKTANSLFAMRTNGTEPQSFPLAAPVQAIGSTSGMFVVLLNMGFTTQLNVLYVAPPEAPRPQFTLGPDGQWAEPGGPELVPDTSSRIQFGSPTLIYVSNAGTIWTSNSWGLQSFYGPEASGSPRGFVTTLAATEQAIYWTEGLAPQRLRCSSDLFKSAQTLCEATPSAGNLAVDTKGDLWWMEAGSAGSSVLYRYDSARKEKVQVWESAESVYAFALIS
jgi:hypothetical protein